MTSSVDIGEAVLEVMSWEPGLLQAFTAMYGGLAWAASQRAEGLTAHALNIGFTPVISPGVADPTRNRISHLDQNYLQRRDVRDRQQRACRRPRRCATGPGLRWWVAPAAPRPDSITGRL